MTAHNSVRRPTLLLPRKSFCAQARPATHAHGRPACRQQTGNDRPPTLLDIPTNDEHHPVCQPRRVYRQWSLIEAAASEAKSIPYLQRFANGVSAPSRPPQSSFPPAQLGSSDKCRVACILREMEPIAITYPAIIMNARTTLGNAYPTILPLILIME